jgi:NTP pyrophosphatase (non-canonical NTP hydrolase)
VNTLNGLAVDIAHENEAKGFWEDGDNELIIPTKLALIHDEVSEALQVHRDRFGDSPEDSITTMTDDQEREFTEELADIIIRTLDLAGHYGFPIGDVIADKLEKNRNRPPKHGKRY